MKLTDREYCYTIEGVFTPSVVVGFTKPALKGDPAQDIKKALADLYESFKVAHLKQIHSAKIHLIKEGGIYEGDGLFTSTCDTVIVVRTADCLPILLHSRNLGIAGVIHMGWRSAREGILDNIPYELSSFKALAGVGLRKCCYAVGKDFLEYSNLSSFVGKNKDGLYFDPTSFAKNALIRHGLKQENFFDTGICSFCSKGNFFSFRRDKTINRTLSFILQLREK
ncbi:MAG: polyphenol oxidase family protein [Candidatus Omnitrophota bacterium]|nr:polyphenol oxidase family protein [Candidatus Omnitrophota bacterium]